MSKGRGPLSCLVISTEHEEVYSPQECSCSHINHACYDKPGAGPPGQITGEYLQTHIHLPSPIVMTSGVGKVKLKCWNLTRSYCIIMSNNLCLRHISACCLLSYLYTISAKTTFRQRKWFFIGKLHERNEITFFVVTKKKL